MLLQSERPGLIEAILVGRGRADVSRSPRRRDERAIQPEMLQIAQNLGSLVEPTSHHLEPVGLGCDGAVSQPCGRRVALELLTRIKRRLSRRLVRPRPSGY